MFAIGTDILMVDMLENIKTSDADQVVLGFWMNSVNCFLLVGICSGDTKVISLHSNLWRGMILP